VAVAVIMILEIIDDDEWLEEQVNILKAEYDSQNIKLETNEQIVNWLDDTDLIQVLTENFDYDLVVIDKKDFSNEEFSKQSTELFQKMKQKVIKNFLEEINK